MSLRSQTEAYQLFQSPEFIEALYATARYTADNEREATFHATLKSGQLAVSRVVTAHDQPGPTSIENTSIDLELIGDYGSVERDIAFALHSHPTRFLSNPRGVSPKDVLVPSLADLKYAESLERVNPGYIDAILSTEYASGTYFSESKKPKIERAYLALFRRIDASRPNYYQRFEGENTLSVGCQRFLKTMQDSGFGVAKLAYNFRLKHYEGNLGQQIQKLFMIGAN